MSGVRPVQPLAAAVLLFALLALVLLPAPAAEVMVAPGTGALQAAIGAASDGDVLVLAEGAYVGNVTLNKSLTVRAVGRGAVAYVGSSGYTFTVEGAGIRVTLQGLTFDMQVAVKQAAEVNILENHFLPGRVLSLAAYETSAGDGTLAIVGNRFENGADIMMVRSDDAYIAGNTLQDAVVYGDRGGLWLVGNAFSGSVRLSSYTSPVLLQGTYGEARVIGNRVDYRNSIGSMRDIFSINNPVAFVVGNRIKAEENNSNLRGIYAANFAEISNNIVYRWGSYSGTGDIDAIRASTGRISGNIVVGRSRTAIAGNLAAVENNLCFQARANTCGSPADGNLIEIDPQFIDLNDFELAAGSPAIDAGPADPWYADLDRTRNDMGAHGGPWAIGQYDAQRAPEYLGPFVYPLFKANSSLSGGVMHIKALGVARLR